MVNKWIEWNGGECPVTKMTLVDVKFRDNWVRETSKAGDLRWSHGGDFDDILGWRPHKNEQTDLQTWNGEGLPPVGTECEHCPGGTTQNDWEIVTVLGVSERPGGVFTDYWLRKEDGSSYIIGNPYRFRPIRTEAERRREEAIKAMINCSAVLLNPTANLIYNAIAAGEIPGVKLED